MVRSTICLLAVAADSVGRWRPNVYHWKALSESMAMGSKPQCRCGWFALIVYRFRVVPLSDSRRLFT